MSTVNCCKRVSQTLFADEDKVLGGVATSFSEPRCKQSRSNVDRETGRRPTNIWISTIRIGKTILKRLNDHLAFPSGRQERFRDPYGRLIAF